MLVEMDYETSSNILKEVLVEDYKNIQRDIERLCQEETLAPHKQEDFKNFVEISDALEIMMKYYFVASEANDIIEENSYDRHLSRANPSDKSLPINTYNDAERMYMGVEF